ncbi:MAG TPA: response regulator, partial [Sporichthyaceae bacterium]|nr:response regulator [Sporichthyaceae bacterium]
RRKTREVPIIFLTAVDAGPDYAFRGYAAGAVDYISKPFDPWVLRAKVSVFVELWSKNAQLIEAAEAGRRRDADHTTLTAAARAAQDVLRTAADADDPDKLRRAIGEAQDLLRSALS